MRIDNQPPHTTDTRPAQPKTTPQPTGAADHRVGEPGRARRALALVLPVEDAARVELDDGDLLLAGGWGVGVGWLGELV